MARPRWFGPGIFLVGYFAALLTLIQGLTWVL